MKQLILILLMLPFCLFGQGKKSFSSGRVHKDSRTTSPWVFAYPVNDTTITIWWTKESTTGYVLQRASLPDYSNATTIYSGTSTSYNDTGRSPETTYYYRIKRTNSKWFNCSATTYPDALFFFDYRFLRDTIINEYGSMSTSPVTKIDTMKSITSSIRAVGTVGRNLSNNKALTNTSSYVSTSDYLLNSPVVLSGDFTVYIRCVAPTSQFLNKSDNSQYLQLSTTAFTLFEGTGDQLSVSYQHSVSGDTVVDMILQRSLDTLKVSIDGGVTFTSNRANNIGGSIQIDKIMGGFSRFVLVVDDKIWNAATIANIVNKPTSDYTFRKQGMNTPQGLIFSHLDSAYYVDNTYTLTPYMTHPWTDNVYELGEYTVINTHTDPTQPSDMVDLTFFVKEDSISQRFEFAQTTIANNLHDAGTSFAFDDKIIHAEPSAHYAVAATNTSTTEFFVSGGDMDMSNFHKMPTLRGVPTFNRQAQYVQFQNKGSNIYMLCQKWNASGYADKVILVKSNGLKSFEQINLCNTGNSRWLYPSWIRSEDDTLRITMKETHPTDSTSNNVYFIWSVDGYVWYNLSGSYSKDVRVTQFSKSDLRTNCLVKNAPGGSSGQVNNNYCFYYPSTGEMYFVTGDGTNTSLVLYKGFIGGSGWTAKTLDAGGKTLIVDQSSTNNEHGSNNPFAIKRGANTYDLYCHEDNSNAWSIVRFRTTDGGNTWAFQEIIAKNTGKKINRMAVTLSPHYANKITMIAYRQQDGNSAGNHHLFIKDITN